MDEDYILLGMLAKEVKQMTHDRREKIEKQIEQYKTACWLSKGPCKDRSAHWTEKALTLRGQLSRHARSDQRKQFQGNRMPIEAGA